MASAPTRRVMASRLGQVSTQLKSPPAEKLLPAPPRTMTGTSGSAGTRSVASMMARASSASKAFIAFGRLRVKVATPSSTRVITVEVMARSHPEDAELRRTDRLVHRRRQGKRQRRARVDRVEDAVVPQPRRGVVGMALAVVLLADRLLKNFFLFLRPRLAPRLDVVAPHGGEHARRLLTAHHRDARAGPHPQEARPKGAAAHAVIARAVAAADDHRAFRHADGRDRGHHLGAVAGDAAGLVFAADHEARDVLQEEQWNAALATQFDEVRGF